MAPNINNTPVTSSSTPATQAPSNSSLQAILGPLGWQPGYYRKRPPSILKNVQSSARGIDEAAMGVLPVSQLQADILTINEAYEMNRKTRVMRIITPKVFPRIVLNRRANDTVDDLVALPSDYKLEGDLHSYFEIMYEKGTEQASLAVLTPDVMRTLINLPQNIDIELSKSSIFIYFRAGMAPLDAYYSTHVLFITADLLTKELVNKTHPAAGFSDEFMRGLTKAYTVSGGTKAKYYLGEFVLSSVFYWGAVLWLGSGLLRSSSETLRAGTGLAMLLGYGLVTFFLIRRGVRMRSAQ